MPSSRAACHRSPRYELAARTSRKAARRQALFLLYQWDLTGQELASLFEGEPDDFARSLAESVDVAGAPGSTRGSRRASPDWPADRLGTLERNILRIGVYELEEETVPREVAINEAVVLAKRYATEDAARLVERHPRPDRPRGGRVSSRRRRARPCRGAPRHAQRAAREELERLAAADDVDGDAAVDLIGELAELARQIEAELTRARALADAAG